MSSTMAFESDSREINLIIEGQVFRVFKNVLCEHSDYFAAMFSGNYVEKDKTDITINVIEADSMEIILRYINMGLIDLSEFSLNIISKLAMASNFLQISELNKQIEYWLDLQLSLSNWVEIMTIAEKASYVKLEKLAGSFGLLSFKHMKPEYIPNLQKLIWYLSHPYLDTTSELDVFKFGYKWILHPQTCVCADILLIILGCLDMTRLTCLDLKEIILLMDNCENSLAAKVVECLKMLLDNKLPISMSTLVKFGKQLCETFSESVYAEVYNMVQDSNQRKLEYTPVAAAWVYNDHRGMDYVPHYVYTFSMEKGFAGWLEAADKNTWGWNVAAWGANKLVLVCGEYGRGNGHFMDDVKIYDTFKQVWTLHGVKLPPRRHAGVAIVGDQLFIVGGVGAYRIVGDTTIIYDLRNRSFRKAAKFPEAIQSPAMCNHYGSMYAAGQKNIYKYEDNGEKDAWVSVMTTEMRVGYMTSHKGYVYCSQSFYNQLYRFRPGIDVKLELLTSFSACPVGFCSMGDHLLAFTRSLCQNFNNQFSVERYSEPCKCAPGKKCNTDLDSCCLGVVETLWSDPNPKINVNDIAGTCTLVMNMPIVETTPSNFHKKYMSRYGEITYNMGVEDLPRDS